MACDKDIERPDRSARCGKIRTDLTGMFRRREIEVQYVETREQTLHSVISFVDSGPDLNAE